MEAQTSSLPPRVGPKPVNPSCFGNIEDVRDYCEKAANRVDRVINRLCGTVPESAAAGTEMPADGLFAAADAQARNIRENMERIFAALDRLEKHLP